MYLLAQDYENEGNFDNAFFWYNKAAMQGLADGINNVAMYYLEGLVVTRMLTRLLICWKALQTRYL